MLDLEGLLQPVAEGAPSGADLKYTAEYGDLERAVEGKPERQVGATTAPAEPPEWKIVLEKGQALFKSSKDLRVAIILVRALVEVQGFAGLGEGLALVRGIVERHWDTFYPQLDKEDDNDPTARSNAMAELTSRDMLQAIRSAPLVVSRSFGAVNMKMLEGLAGAPKAPAAGKPAAPAPAAKGAAPAPPAPTAASVEAAFQQAPLDAVVNTVAALAGCVDDAKKLAEGWSARLEGVGPDFGELRKLLAQALKAVQSRAEARQASEAGGAGGAAGGEGAAGDVPGALTSIRGEVLSRDDVLRAIDAICAYYARNEPSSPVPLLLLRGKRLVTMSFMDILKEMLPESVANVQKITGKTDA